MVVQTFFVVAATDCDVSLSEDLSFSYASFDETWCIVNVCSFFGVARNFVVE